MQFRFNDGGRAAAGFKGSAGDCVTRAVAIGSGLPYAEVYAALAKGQGSQRASKRTPKGPASARDGINVSRKWFKDYMAGLGFRWVSCMGIGTGCQTHLKAGEIPATGVVIAQVSKHYTAVIDGVINDTHNPSRDGTRCVYGYWTR